MRPTRDGAGTVVRRSGDAVLIEAVAVAIDLHAAVMPLPLNGQDERIDSRSTCCARALPDGVRDYRA